MQCFAEPYVVGIIEYAKKNYHWKSNETVFRSKIVLKEAVDNTGQKT